MGSVQTKLELPQSNIDKINMLDETKTSRINIKFHNKFFESHLKEPNKKYNAATYYQTFYRLTKDGKLNKLQNRDECTLLKDWAKFYNENLGMTMEAKPIEYVESLTECSIKIN
jgi:hypothetical protein